MRYIYSDPTGGGDDITLDAPAWVEPPSSIRVTDTNGERHVFDFDGED